VNEELCRIRIRSIEKARPIAYRAKVLGRALLSARTDPNRVWVLLSGNAEVVAFASTAVTTTPVPASIGASVNTAAVNSSFQYKNSFFRGNGCLYDGFRTGLSCDGFSDLLQFTMKASMPPASTSPTLWATKSFGWGGWGLSLHHIS
jgi:hypothetical protein